jgi:NADPH-dependent curcumin reductase CurA
VINHAYRLRRRPVGAPVVDDLELVSEELPPLSDGEALVRTLYLSLDPTNRLWMSDMRQYSPPVVIGDVMRGIGIGEVVASRREDLPVGALVSGYTDWQEYRITALDDERPLNPLPDPLPAPASAFLGALGHTGLTAYIGLELIGGVHEGETLVVSAACGAVGSVVGQIAKDRGARAVPTSACISWSGSASTPRSIATHPTGASNWPAPPPTASMSASRMSAARSWTRCSRG